MSAIPIKRKIELLEQLLMSDVWTEFLLPEYKEAADIRLAELKYAKDQFEAAKIIGQLLGFDAIVNLPALLPVLKQMEVQAAETPSADPA